MSRTSKFGKCRDSRGTFWRQNLNFASLRNDERSCRLANKGGRFEGFIIEGSLSKQSTKKNLHTTCVWKSCINFEFWLSVGPKYLSTEKKEENNLFVFDHIQDHQVNLTPSLGTMNSALCTMHYALSTLPYQKQIKHDFKQIKIKIYLNLPFATQVLPHIIFNVS